MKANGKATDRSTDLLAATPVTNAVVVDHGMSPRHMGLTRSQHLPPVAITHPAGIPNLAQQLTTDHVTR
jgi:hypothetical protein